MHYTRFPVVILLSIALSSHGLLAQNTTLQGRVVDVVAGDGIQGASIKNLVTGKTASTRNDGTFQLAVSKFDVLVSTAPGFFPDSLRVNDSLLATNMLFIRLRPLPGTLEGVTITANMNPYQIDSMKRRQDYLQRVGGEYKMPTVSRANDLGFGVGINLDKLGKSQKAKRDARNLYEYAEDEAYVNYRWSEEIVRKYTSFDGDTLYEFMDLYRPEYEWLRQNSEDSDIGYHINKSLKKFRRLKD